LPEKKEVIKQAAEVERERNCEQDREAIISRTLTGRPSVWPPRNVMTLLSITPLTVSDNYSL
jgi:hypothetical protein